MYGHPHLCIYIYIILFYLGLVGVNICVHIIYCIHLYVLLDLLTSIPRLTSRTLRSRNQECDVWSISIVKQAM